MDTKGAKLGIPYRFRLRIEANDHGERRFEESGEFQDQQELERSVTHAIARALEACFCSPPPSEAIMAAMESGGLAYGFAVAKSRYWDGTGDFKDAVSITIDVDLLMGDFKPKERDRAAKVLELCGIQVIRSSGDSRAVEAEMDKE